MKIQSMFQKDINRDINGVIKVSQDDQQSLKQELSEYIITKELRRHFATFFDNYVKAIDNPTDKIGVWISGFFGSGKSHFLKMLSYLLSNKEVDGKHAFDYFTDKFDDPMMYDGAEMHPHSHGVHPVQHRHRRTNQQGQDRRAACLCEGFL